MLEVFFKFGILTALIVRIVLFWEVMMNNLLEFCKNSSCLQRGICDTFVYVLKFIKPILKRVRKFVKSDY